MYTGTLIEELLATAERVRKNGEMLDGQWTSLEPEEFPQALRLGTADRNLGLFFVVHPQLVGTLKPRHDLADAIDVDEVGAVSAPKEVAVEAVQQLLERPAVGLTFHPRCARSHNCDHAVFDPCITDIFLVHEKHPAGCP